MAAYLYTDVKVTGEANSETTNVALTAPEGVTYIIDSVTPTEITGTLQADAQLKAWKEREKIVDENIVHTLGSNGSNVRYTPPSIQVGHELAAGKSLIVGHVSGGTPSDIRYLIKYHRA